MIMSQVKNLADACLYALKHNLNLKHDERVLIIMDEEKRMLGDAFKKAALILSAQVEMKEIPVLDYSGQEPPSCVAEDMLYADVILMPLSKSLSWTKARLRATERGTRIVSMPGITPETVLRTFRQDYGHIRQRVNRLCDLLDEAETIHVSSAIGTDLTFSIKRRKGRGRRGGVYTEKGAWGNLPCGEAFVAPVEGTAQGVYLVDASHSEIGIIEDFLRIEVQDGRATGISGGSQSRLLLNLLKSMDHPDAFNFAEFGLGCNDRAEVCGVTLEDEKALGTCHMALGANALFGGKINVGIHLDGVIRVPTVKFDGTTIMQRGRLHI